MTLELLQFIKDNTIHLQGQHYQIIQVIEKTTETLIKSIQNTESNWQ